MGFKFDDNDDSLSLDLGKDSPKVQDPAPLPKIQPKKEALGKLPKPGQSAPAKTSLPKTAVPSTASAPKIPSKPSVTKPVETEDIVKPVPKPVKKVEKPEEVTVEELIDDTYESEELTFVDEPLVYEEEEVTTKEPQPILNTQQGRRTRQRQTYVQGNEFVPESEHVLSQAEASKTIKKSSPFEGDRKRIMQIRFIATVVVVLLMAAGVYSFIPKPGFKDDVSQINAAISYANKYDAIQTVSENYALRFTTDFLNRTEYTEPLRVDTMKTYMDFKTISAVDFNLTNLPATQTGKPQGVNIYMKLVSGPFIYSINNIDASKIQAQRIENGNGYIYSIVTSAYVQPYIAQDDLKYVSTAIELTPQWVYLSIPVMHNYLTKQTTLYGFPTFVTPEKTSGLDAFSGPLTEADWKQSDDTLSNNSVLEAQLEAFMVAWAKQSPNEKLDPALQAVLSKSATERTKVGLSGKYTSADKEQIIYNVNVKPLPEGDEPTASTKREALVTVKWVDAQTASSATAVVPAVYTQQYLIDFQGAGDKWQVIDIKPRFAE